MEEMFGMYSIKNKSWSENKKLQINYFGINQNILLKILFEYSQMWSSFEELNVKNKMVQSKFNFDN